MDSARFDRIAVAVDDIEAAAADLRAVFGIELRIFDVENLQIKAALGEDGFELIQKTSDQIPIAANWNSPITSFAIRVDDLEVARARMAAKGIELTNEFTTPGGMVELYYGAPGLHGIPITLCQYGEDDGFMHSTGADASGTDFQPTIR